MKDVMIDLETLGTGPEALVISIGACKFDRASDTIGATFYINIDWQESIDRGRKITADTLKWWMDQKPEALKATLNNGEPYNTALIALSNFIGSNTSRVWGNGSGFDITILESMYTSADLDIPWAFWNIRDCRTVKDLSLYSGIEEDLFELKEGTAHNALDDAKHQARWVMECINFLGGM